MYVALSTLVTSDIASRQRARALNSSRTKTNSYGAQCDAVRQGQHENTITYICRNNNALCHASAVGEPANTPTEPIVVAAARGRE